MAMEAERLRQLDAHDEAARLQSEFEAAYRDLVDLRRRGDMSTREDCGPYIQSLVEAGIEILDYYVPKGGDRSMIFNVLADTLLAHNNDPDVGFHPGYRVGTKALSIRDSSTLATADDRMPHIVVIHVVNDQGVTWRWLVDFDRPVEARNNGIFVAQLKHQQYKALATGERVRIVADHIDRTYEPVAPVARLTTPANVLWPRPIGEHDDARRWLEDMAFELTQAVAQAKAIDYGHVIARFGLGNNSGMPTVPVNLRAHIMFRHAVSRTIEARSRPGGLDGTERMFWGVHGIAIRKMIASRSGADQDACATFFKFMEASPDDRLYSWEGGIPNAVHRVVRLLELAGDNNGVVPLAELRQFGLPQTITANEMTALVDGARLYQEMISAQLHQVGFTEQMNHIHLRLHGVALPESAAARTRWNFDGVR